MQVLRVVSVSELVDDIEIGGSLGCSEDVLMDFRALRDTGQVKSQDPNFQESKITATQEVSQ